MIPDVHTVPAHWGIRPVLFTVGGQPVSSYAVFVTLGVVAAVALYYANTRGHAVGNDGLAIAIAAAVGGILGAKVPIWIAHLPEILADPGPSTLLSGRTIVGGLLGGFGAVLLVKRRLGITRKMGNFLVPSLCAGIALGRVGCFLAGCCYGTATNLPWGVDFGDGVARHPTQLYEAVFVLGLLAYALLRGERFAPGRLFRWFMLTYFAWRFAIEFIRVNEVAAFGMTYYQITAVGVVLAYAIRLMVGRRLERSLE